MLGSAGLVTIGPSGRAQPALAARWEQSPDGTTWHFHLKPGLTFHDGSPLDAAAVRAAIAPGASSMGTPGPAPGLSDVRRVDAASDLELIVSLARPSSLLLEALALIRIGGSQEGAGAGAFRLASRLQGTIGLTAFEGFYRGRPLVDAIEIRGYPAPRAAWTALMRGEVDLLYEVPPESVEFVRAAADVTTFSFLRPYAYLLGVNLRHPLLARLDVRRALNAAIDRQAIVDRALGGRGQPAFDHVFPRHWAYDAHVPAQAFDPREAARRLDAAGLVPSRPQAPRRLAHRFGFTCLVPADYPLIERMALLVQKQLADIGVDMAVEAVPVPQFVARLAEGRFDAYLFELAAGHGFNFPYLFWRSSTDAPPLVASGYRAADAALDRLRLAHTDDEEAAAVRGLQEIMRSDPPGVFLGWGETSRAMLHRFEVPADPGRDVIATIERWRLRREEPSR
jgi:peptide/nickel transport system substrate-binding protein